MLLMVLRTEKPVNKSREFELKVPLSILPNTIRVRPENLSLTHRHEMHYFRGNSCKDKRRVRCQHACSCSHTVTNGRE